MAIRVADLHASSKKASGKSSLLYSNKRRLAKRGKPSVLEASDWFSSSDQGSIFKGCVTLDPNEVVQAWSELSRDTFAAEISRMPRIMHRALKATLIASRVFTK